MKTLNRNILPLCPRTLISLLDMIHFSVKELESLVVEIRDREGHIRSFPPKTEDQIHHKAEILIHFLERISEIARKLELIETSGRCSRFLQELRWSIQPFEFPKGNAITLDEFTPQEFVRELKGIGDAASNELSQIKFTFIPQSKDKFFDQEKLFGNDVYEAFPSAREEIRSAGNCLAVDLNTAAVFHLMRAAEFGMRKLAIYLGVRLKRKPIEHGGWNELIEQIEKKVSVRRQRYDKKRRKNKKELEFLKFCRMMADELFKFKEIWRNNTMHSISNYSENEALGVFERVRDFMKRLSKEVK